MSTRRLAVFDFDQTIVDANTDIFVRDLIDSSAIPEEVSLLYKPTGWTDYMQAVFRLLKNHGITERNVLERLRLVRAIDGMPELLRQLHATDNIDIIVISDCNKLFIDTWLEYQGLSSSVERVISNPAFFDADGLLCLKKYHVQNDCTLSTNNLCKGRILDDLIAEKRSSGVTYSQVIFVGDGLNDFCPMLRLRTGDLACVRNGYKCATAVRNALNGKEVGGAVRKLLAQPVFWDNANDISGAVFNNN